MLDSLPVIDGQIPDSEGSYTVTLPKTGSTVKIRPLTYGEITEINNYEKSYPVGRTAPKVTWRLNKQITELNGKNDRGEISKFIEELPIMDSKFIRKFLEENVPRLDLTRTVTAPSGEKLIVNVGFGVDFFRPFF